MIGRRLCLVHHGYFPNVAGAELMTHHLAEAMRHRGYDVALYCSELGTEAAGWMARVGVSVDPLPASVDERRRPDIVHAVDSVWPEYCQSAALLAQEWEVPFVFTPASDAEISTDWAAVLNICRRADAVFALTWAEREMLLKGGVRDSALHVIGQGAHVIPSRDPSRFRRSYCIEGPMVLFVGRKMRSKGFALLLEASRLVWANVPNTYFVFIGPRWDEDCEEIFAAYAEPRIIELGQVDEIEKADAMAACDVLCLPSTQDVFPLVYVEAWTNGKPVVGSTFEGGREVVWHGVNGLIAQPEPKSVAAALTKLVANPRYAKALGAAGRARALREFGWGRVAERVDEVYRTLLSSAARFGVMR